MTTVFQSGGDLVPITRTSARRRNAGGAGDRPGAPTVGTGELRILRRSGPAEVEDEDLHAYVDACLDPCRRARIEARLARCPEQQLRVAAYRAINMNLHALLDCDLPPAPRSLADLSGDLERRLTTIAAAPRRRVPLPMLPAVRWAGLTGAWRGCIAAAAGRAPAAGVVAMSGAVAAFALAWALIEAAPASCAERVNVLAKEVAEISRAGELGEALAKAGSLCGGGGAEQADAILSEVDGQAKRHR